MTDGQGPATAEDLRLEGHLTVTTGAGTKIVEVKVDQLLRGVVLDIDLDGSETRFGLQFFWSIVSPIRSALRKYIARLRPAPPANEFYARVDAFVPSRGRIDWYDEPAEIRVDEQRIHQFEQARMLRAMQQLDLD